MTNLREGYNMPLTPSRTKYSKLHIKPSDFVYLDLESPVSYTGGVLQCISAVGYTDGKVSVLEYVKFSEDCHVTDAMMNEFNSPPSTVYQQGRTIDVILCDLEKFANNRPIIVFGSFDKKLIAMESRKLDLYFNLNLVDFRTLVETPNKNYSLSVSRLVEVLGIKGDFVEHNPLHDAFKLKAIHEAYEDTPELRKKVFDAYIKSELKSILKTTSTLSSKLEETAHMYLGYSEGVAEHFTTTLLKLLEESARSDTDK